MTGINIADVTQHCHKLQCSDTTIHSDRVSETTEQKVNIQIYESTLPKESGAWGKIGKFKRTARKNVYVSPRLLLPRDYEKTIGETVVILKARLSIEGFSWLQNKDALILVLQGPYEEPKAHMVLPKGEQPQRNDDELERK
jgi:hypothetical protein